MRAAWIATGLLLASASAASADGGSAPREQLFRGLGAEVLAERDDAARALERSAELTEGEVRAALKTAPRVAAPLLIRVAAARGMKGLVPDLVAALASPDPVVTDAAARALVKLGDAPAAAGIAALLSSKEPGAVAVRTRLTALAAQRVIEREVVGKWRRKGGTYEHRFDDLAQLGWSVQPVLLAMLLDVPLSDHHVVLPETKDEQALEDAKKAVLLDIARSDRRGYRTFEPLPVTIEQEELFDLAAQALKDVADLDLMGDILEQVSENLQQVDELHGWRLRPWEERFYRDIDVLLFARGRPQRLERFAEKCRERVEVAAAWLSRAEEVGRGSDQKQQISVALSEYASALHQLRRYDEAAARFAQVIRFGRELTGKEPAIASYNRACALSRAGRRDEALRQLDRSLDRDRSSGAEDLTREWVTEDGDLSTLHDDPRFKAIIVKRFGEAGDARASGTTGPGEIPPVPPQPPVPPPVPRDPKR